jgi:hypothetical protein
MAAKSSNLMALLDMAPSAFAGGEVSPPPPIKSLADLKDEVQKHFGKLTGQELDALVGWFNRNFFRLKD